MLAIDRDLREVLLPFRGFDKLDKDDLEKIPELIAVPKKLLRTVGKLEGLVDLDGLKDRVERAIQAFREELERMGRSMFALGASDPALPGGDMSSYSALYNAVLAKIDQWRSNGVFNGKISDAIEARVLTRVSRLRDRGQRSNRRTSEALHWRF